MAEADQAAALLLETDYGTSNKENEDTLYGANHLMQPHYLETHDEFIDNCGHDVVSDNGQEDSPEIDININNVVCSFNTRCHLDLRRIAMEGAHVEYKRENGMCNMKIRNPYTTASIWSSGKITCTGATSEEYAKIAARKFARSLQRMGFKVRFTNFRIVNVLGTCSMPFRIKINNFSRKFRENASYEPELHPGVTYRIPSPKATLKIFSTGSLTITAPCVDNIRLAIEHIYPLVSEFSADEEEIDKTLIESEVRFMKKQNSVNKPKQPVMNIEDCQDVDSDEELESEESFESDVSQD